METLWVVCKDRIVCDRACREYSIVHIRKHCSRGGLASLLQQLGLAPEACDTEVLRRQPVIGNSVEANFTSFYSDDDFGLCDEMGQTGRWDCGEVMSFCSFALLFFCISPCSCHSKISVSRVSCLVSRVSERERNTPSQ